MVFLRVAGAAGCAEQRHGGQIFQLCNRPAEQAELGFAEEQQVAILVGEHIIRRVGQPSRVDRHARLGHRKLGQRHRLDLQAVWIGTIRNEHHRIRARNRDAQAGSVQGERSRF